VLETDLQLQKSVGDGPSVAPASAAAVPLAPLAADACLVVGGEREKWTLAVVHAFGPSAH